MRLTLVNQFYVPDLAPTGHMAASLAEYRAQLGDVVTVVTSTGGYVPQSPIESRADSDNPRVFRLWTPRAGKGSGLARALDYLSFYGMAALRMVTLPRQDVIISLTTPPFIAWTAVLHKTLHRGTRIVLWNMDCYPEIAERTGVIRPGGWTSRILRWLNRRLFAQLSGVVSLDHAMQDLLRSAYKPPSDHTTWQVIPNWEAAAQFPAHLDPPKWGLVDRLHLDGQFVVLYLGNAGFGHRFESILEAAEQLIQEPIQWVFVGGGSKWGWLRSQTAEKALKNIHLVPYVPKSETPSVMAAADCALVTMTEKALGAVSPSKLHSCLAMGLPILYVGPEGGNVHEAVQRYGMGVSIRHGDVEGVIDFARQLRRNRDLHDDLSHRARRAFEEAYVDNVTLPQFDEFLSRVLQETGTAKDQPLR